MKITTWLAEKFTGSCINFSTSFRLPCFARFITGSTRRKYDMENFFFQMKKRYVDMDLVVEKLTSLKSESLHEAGLTVFPLMTGYVACQVLIIF